MTDSSHSPRCRAAHPEDRSACDGPPDAVRIADLADAAVEGCVHHGARLRAGLTTETRSRQAHRYHEALTIENLATAPADPVAEARTDRLRHAASITRWRVDGMTRDRLLLLASGRLPAGERDLALIAEAAGVTADWLLHG